MNPLFSDNLYYLEKFRNIINILNFLESDNPVLFQVFKTIEQLKEILYQDENLLNDWITWEKRNPDYIWFSKFSKYTCLYEERIFNYTPLITACVERSFSVMGNIMTDKRCNLTVENLGNLIILHNNRKKQ